MFSLFNKPELRRFNLTPRYWDPEKEAKEEREKRVRAELGLKNEETVYTPNVKGQFRNEYGRRKAARSSISSARTIRLFMILLMLFIGAFYVFIKNPDGLLRLFGL